MNERIIELANEANKDIGYTFKMEEAKQLHELMEKFAELIIKEYEQFLPEMCPWAGANEEGPTKGWHVQFVARKHFGVEE
jgi:hypothetical protein